MKRKFFITLTLAACMLVSGCVTAIRNGYIISVKERFFGIDVSEGANQVPHVKLGFGSVVYMMIPTSTNQIIYAPKFIDTFSIDQSLNPFGFEVRENTGTGDVMIGTNATGSAIVPKAAAPIHGNTTNGH